MSKDGGIYCCCLSVATACTEIIISFFQRLTTENNEISFPNRRIMTIILNRDKHEGKYDITKTFCDEDIAYAEYTDNEMSPVT